MIRQLHIIACLALVIGWLAPLNPALADDKDYPPYQPASDVSGSVACVTSPSTAHMLGQWQEAFAKLQPKVRINAANSEADGAFAALLKGQVALAMVSREMTAKEREAFEKQHGYTPRRLIIARDALVVYVNRRNPIAGLTLQQVDSIFSAKRLRGGQRAAKWGDLGLTGDWANRPLNRIHGLDSNTSLGHVFQQKVLKGAPMVSSIETEPGGSSVVNAVGAFDEAVGFSDHHFRSRRVKQVPLAERSGGKFIAPTPQNCMAGRYPLVRDLYVYIFTAPGKPLPAPAKQFLLFVNSETAQNIVAQEKDFPISPTEAQRQTAALK